MNTLSKRTTLMLIGAGLVVGLWAPSGTWAQGRQQPTGGGVIVEPLRVELQGGPKSELPFKVSVISAIPRPLVMEVIPMDATQMGNGTPEFTAAGENNLSCGTWIKSTMPKTVVETKSEHMIDASVVIPNDAAGDRLCTLMIQLTPDMGPEKKQASAGLILRYAVFVTIKIDRTKGQPKLGVRSVEWSEEGNPELTAEVVNNAGMTVPVKAEAVVMQTETQRIVSRLNMTSMKANDPIQEQALYPGGFLKFRGALPRPLPPGKYASRLVVRYADHRTLIFDKDLEITDDRPGEAKAHATTLAWDNDPVDITLAPGGFRVVPLGIGNPTNDAQVVVTEVKPLSDQFCAGWSFEIATQIPVPAGMRRGFPLSVKAPKESERQCVAHLIATVEGASVNPPPQLVKFGLTGWSPEISLQGLTLSGKQFTVKAKNVGPLSVKPTVVVKFIPIGSEESTGESPMVSAVAQLFPGEETVYQGTVPPDLKTGKYKAQAVLQCTGKPVCAAESSLVDVKIP